MTTQKQILDGIQKELNAEVEKQKQTVIISLENVGFIPESHIAAYNDAAARLKAFLDLRDPNTMHLRNENQERWFVSDALRRSIIGKLSQIKQVTHDDYSYYPVNISAIARYIVELLEEHMNQPKIVLDQ